MFDIIDFSELESTRKTRLLVMIIRLSIVALLTNKIMNHYSVYFDKKFDLTILNSTDLFLSGKLIFPAFIFLLVLFIITDGADLVFLLLAQLAIKLYKKLPAYSKQYISSPIQLGITYRVLKVKDGKIYKGRLFSAFQDGYVDISSKNHFVRKDAYTFTCLSVGIMLVVFLYSIYIPSLLYIPFEIYTVYRAINYIAVAAIYSAGEDFIREILLAPNAD